MSMSRALPKAAELFGWGSPRWDREMLATGTGGP